MIVGAAGTLGARLVERLGARGVDLRCSDPREERFVPELGQADVVVNVGGPRVRAGLGWVEYFREHVGVTTTVVRSMRPGARLVHVSSTAVYGARGESLRATSREAPTLFPSPAYACAKLAAETAARALGRQSGLQVRVLRPSMVYGPDVESALATIRRLHRRGVRLLFLPSRVRQHVLHVSLLVRCVEAATRTPLPGDEGPLLLADPFVLTNTDLAPATRRGVPVAVDVQAAAWAHGALARAIGFAPDALEALAVLGLDNEFDVAATWPALSIDPAEFSRARTFDPYWTGDA
jgi:nucleoside-diphosphate-sugar epimerase